MTRAATAKLIDSVVVAAVLLWLGLIAGRLELVVVAAPVLVAIALGIVTSSEPDLLVECELEGDRCLENDVVVATITVSATEDVTDLRVALVVPPAFSLMDTPADTTIALPAGGSHPFTVELRADRWGVHQVGTVALRAAGPGRYLVWEEVVHRPTAVKVFPYLERIRSGVAPPETQLYAGNYVSRDSGDGIEFARVRTFQPGDRVRSVNWRVTTRRDSLHVNVFHPERNADVIVFLDSFGNFGGAETGSLEMAVRGAAGVVRRYLAHKDRVGLVAFGGEVRWLTASMSRTQVYRIVDVLLESRALFSYAWKGIEHLPFGTLPTSATVIAFSPLIDRRAVEALVDIAARGFPLAVVDTLAEDEVEAHGGAEGELARRVWLLARSARRAELASLGVPVVRWHEADGLDAALASVPRLPKVRMS